ncbi:hypothetical protein BY996DRAFT_6716046 [Phakopsora pachyrhizi]|nr:hypothetical protein BY996DRAFT_6716046 [Phakopsora pachyrhizi]
MDRPVPVPPKLIRVYGKPVALNPAHSSLLKAANVLEAEVNPLERENLSIESSSSAAAAAFTAPSKELNGNDDPLLRRRTLQEEMDEIDRMDDDELDKLTEEFRSVKPHQPSSSQPGQTNSAQPSCSSQPSLDAAPPTSMNKSGTTLQRPDSPSSSLPITPKDFSPLASNRNSKGGRIYSKRLRIADSDSDDQTGTNLRGGIDKSKSGLLELPSRSKTSMSAETFGRGPGGDDDDELPTLEQVYSEERRLALAAAEEELELEAEPYDENFREEEPTKIAGDADRGVDEMSETELETFNSPKRKKIKGLTKKEKQENQRTVASLRRRKEVRLTATCRAPYTRLQDIITKADESIALASGHKTKHLSLPKSPKKNTQLSKIITYHEQTSERPPTRDNPDVDPPKTSPIGEFFVHQTATDGPQKIDVIDDINYELPDFDEAFLTSKSGKPVILPDTKINKSKQKIEPQNNGKGKFKQVQTVERSTIIVNESDSDSDLDIIGKPTDIKERQITDYLTIEKPTTATLSKTSNPSRRGSFKTEIPETQLLTSRAAFRLESRRVGGSAPLRLKTADYMQSLLVKSAIDGAKIRKQKQAEFLERGGKLKERGSNLNSEQIDVKAILKKSAERLEKEMEEEGVENDWDEFESEGDILYSGDEGSSAEDGDRESGNASLVESDEEKIETSKQDIEDHFSDIKDTHCEEGKNVLAPNSSSMGDFCGDTDSPMASPKASKLVSFGRLKLPSSPIDLPGFEPVPKLSRESFTAKDNSTTSQNDCLPGFGCLTQGENQTDLVEGFGESPGFLKPSASPGFSQLFGDDDQPNFTHPPPPLKAARAVENDLKLKLEGVETNDNEELGGTCVLPSVRALPEEHERDALRIMMEAQERNMQDEQEEPMVYVNHHGLLTQTKPSMSLNAPPDSPLFSQDMISRTPFALRKDVVHDSQNRDRDEPRTNESEDKFSDWKNKTPGSPSLRFGEDVMSRSQSPVPEAARNAFSVVMKAQAQAKKSHRTGAGKLFLADQAEESEEEDGVLIRRSDDEDENEEGSEAGHEFLKDLVDDGEDEMDEEARLEAKRAVDELAMLHQRQAEEKQAEHIAKVVEGKIRIKQAKKQGHDGGLSDSDSEDDEEAEMIKANKRAQEYAAKKKKRAIHRLAEKHAPFFKAYEEGTTHWADQDDLKCLNPEEVLCGKNETDESGEEDSDESYGTPPQSGLSLKRQGHSKLIRKDDSDVEDTKVLKEDLDPVLPDQMMILSSPVQLPKVKIQDPLRKYTKLSAKSDIPSKHGDLDDLYETKALNQLTERQRNLAAGIAGEEGFQRGRNGTRFGRGAGSKTSSITYQKINQGKRDLKKIENGGQDDNGRVDVTRHQDEGNGEKANTKRGLSGVNDIVLGKSRLARLKKK